MLHCPFLPSVLLSFLPSLLSARLPGRHNNSSDHLSFDQRYFLSLSLPLRYTCPFACLPVFRSVYQPLCPLLCSVGLSVCVFVLCVLVCPANHVHPHKPIQELSMESGIDPGQDYYAQEYYNYEHGLVWVWVWVWVWVGVCVCVLQLFSIVYTRTMHTMLKSWGSSVNSRYYSCKTLAQFSFTLK